MAQHNINSRIILLNDTKANWDTKADKFILLKGEVGIEIDTKKFKIGDGVSTWAELNYVESGSDSDSDNITIPTKLADLLEDETHRTVTDEEKETWNSKVETSDIPTKLPNPHSLTIKQNGKIKGSYDGSNAVEIDLETNVTLKIVKNTLWSGSNSTEGATITLSDNISNYSFLMFIINYASWGSEASTIEADYFRHSCDTSSNGFGLSASITSENRRMSIQYVSDTSIKLRWVQKCSIVKVIGIK